MTKIAHFDGARVIVGVDTREDEHVVLAIAGLGVRPGEHRLRCTSAGASAIPVTSTASWTTSIEML